MSPEQKAFLDLVTKPGRFRANEAAWFLGFVTEDIPVLVSDKLLKPLGHPPRTGSKFFSFAELEQLRNNPTWLAKASDAIVKRWRYKNGQRKARQDKPELLSSPV